MNSNLMTHIVLVRIPHFRRLCILVVWPGQCAKCFGYEQCVYHYPQLPRGAR